jgi:hypothetical protein
MSIETDISLNSQEEAKNVCRVFVLKISLLHFTSDNSSDKKVLLEIQLSSVVIFKPTRGIKLALKINQSNIKT